MKLTQITEARYAGIHPAAKQVQDALDNNEEFSLDINSPNTGQEVIKGLISHFGQPETNTQPNDDEYGSVVWASFENDRILQVVYGLPASKKLARRSGDAHPVPHTRTNIELI